MTRRERMANRLQQRLDWAGSAERKATTRFEGAREALRGIEPGQPILVGHHSERHHRRAIERHDARMRAGVEAEKLAERHRQVADTLESRLDRCVFSDDEDAIPQLEARIKAREAAAARLKGFNVELRRLAKKAEGPALLALALERLKELGATEGERLELAQNCQAFGTRRVVFPSYLFANWSGNNGSDRKRIEAIRAERMRAELASQAKGGVLIQQAPGSAWCRVTFAEKPERRVLVALKQAGYHWGGGSWHGNVDQLPAELQSALSPQPCLSASAT